MSVSATQSVTPTVSAGWVASGTAGTITVSGSAYVAQSAITNNTTLPSGSSSSGTINRGKYIKIGAGYYPSDRYYLAQANSGNIQLTQATSTSVDGYATATVKTGTAAVTASQSIAANPTITWDSTNKKIVSSYSGSKSITGTVSTAGWITSVSSATVTTSGSASIDPASLDSNLTAANIKNGVTIFGITGTHVRDDATVTPTTSYANANMSTYFNSGTSSDYSVSITPRYSNTAGYVAAHTNTTNGGIGYWKIKTTSITEGTTSVSDNQATRGQASWGTGWITGGTMAPASFSNSATSGVTYVDISSTAEAPVLVSGGYLYINKGYTDNMRISLAKLVPDGASADLAAGHILSGYSAYNNDGTLIAGNIATKTASNVTVSGRTVTIPAGYYASEVSKSIGVATVTSGSATISSASYAYDSANTRFNVTGSATIAAPTVNTAGYVSSSEGTKNTNTATLSATVARIAIKAAVSGTTSA